MINGLTFALSFMQLIAYSHRMKIYAMRCINLDIDYWKQIFYSEKLVGLLLNIFFDIVQFVN